MKKIISAFCALLTIGSIFTFTAVADGCSDWQLDHVEHTCPIEEVCMIVGNPNPYLYRYVNYYTRLCVRSNGTTYTETSTRYTTPGSCCRS